MKDQKIQVIQNGIDLDVFTPQKESNKIRTKYNINQKTMLLGVASTWEDRKGLNDFFKLQQIIDKNSVIVLVGLSPKQIKQLPEGIIGITRTENSQELADLYSAADLFINPSVEETFGLTTIEAMACGTPVLVYKATASPELVVQEVGFVIKPHDMEAIIKSINIIQIKGKKYYTNACRIRAEKLYNKKDRFEEYIQLYLKLLSL